MDLCFSIEVGVDLNLGFVDISSDDFEAFRTAVATHVEDGQPGRRCPVLQGPYLGGYWSREECVALHAELALVKRVFGNVPSVLPEDQQAEFIELVDDLSGLCGTVKESSGFKINRDYQG